MVVCLFVFSDMIQNDISTHMDNTITLPCFVHVVCVVCVGVWGGNYILSVMLLVVTCVDMFV